RIDYLLGSWSNRRNQFPNRLEVVFLALADADPDAVANSLDRPVGYGPSENGGLNGRQQPLRDSDLWSSQDQSMPRIDLACLNEHPVGSPILVRAARTADASRPYPVSVLFHCPGVVRGAEHLELPPLGVQPRHRQFLDRKSTRLNSSHVKISYAVFCLKKKNTK